MDSIDWVAERVDTINDLAHAATVLLAVMAVATAYYKTRSLVAVLVAGVAAGAVLWMVNNVGWWQQKVKEETDTAPMMMEMVTGLVPRPPVVVAVVVSAGEQEHRADDRL